MTPPPPPSPPPSPHSPPPSDHPGAGSSPSPGIEALLAPPVEPGRVLVAPSILSADFANLAAESAHVLDPRTGGADLLHIDVMDGHFVPNLTMGPALVASLRGALPDAFLDVHLMVTDPGQYIGPFADAGANHLTIHIEPALNPSAGTGASPLSAGYVTEELAHEIRSRGMTAGLAINPGTEWEAAASSLDRFDLALVMSVEPGFSGQAFRPEVLSKARAIRERFGEKLHIEIDGGASPANAAEIRAAGVDVIVAASAIFGRARAERSGVIRALRGTG